MSVATDVNIPSQPTTGSLELLPLGGNGEIAPRSMQLLRQDLAGDASGGQVTMSFLCDTRFENVITRLQLSASSAAAAVPYSFAADQRPDTTSMVAAGLTFLDTVQAVNNAYWDLPPLFNMRGGSVITDNVDATEVYTLRAWIWNFNIDASRRIPLNLLLSSLPRASFSKP